MPRKQNDPIESDGGLGRGYCRDKAREEDGLRV